MKKLAAWLGVGVLVALTLVLAGWRMSGGSWVRVETPSMGTAAPVGTLLWIKPVPFDSLRPGDLITFTPPGTRGVTYSHQVREVHPDGTVSTEGRITAPDPWRIRSQDVVGKTVMRWTGVGWLVLAAPVLLLGAALVASVACRIRERDARMPVAIIGGALVIVVALLVYRPLTQAERLAFVPDGNGARATYVSTGVLPVRLSAPGAVDVVLKGGETGSVITRVGTRAEGGQRFVVRVRPAVPWGLWLALVGCCFVPALGSLRSRRAAFRN